MNTTYCYLVRCKVVVIEVDGPSGQIFKALLDELLTNEPLHACKEYGECSNSVGQTRARTAWAWPGLHDKYYDCGYWRFMWEYTL